MADEWHGIGKNVAPIYMYGMCFIYGTHTHAQHANILHVCDAEQEMDIQLTIESCVSISFFPCVCECDCVCAFFY